MAQEHIQVAKDTPEVYHFDIFGVRKAGYKVGAHDYEPVLEPIQARFSQDLPQRMRDFDGLSKYDVDPYLPIAKLRRKFEGKGRTLAGYLVMPRGIYDKKVKDKPVRLHHDIPWNRLSICSYFKGMDERGLPEVHPVAMFHLNWIMSHKEREINYWNYVFAKEDCIRKATTQKERDMEIEALRSVQSGPNMQMNRLMSADGVRNFIKAFPKPAQQRQVLSPPGIVNIPIEKPLTWVDLEGAIKRACEDMMNSGCYVIQSVDVIACDETGAYTVGCSLDGFITSVWAEWGVKSHAVQFQRAYSNFAEWLGWPDNAYNLIKDFMANNYDAALDAYFARELHPSYERHFRKDTFKDMQDFRKVYLEAQRKGELVQVGAKLD